MQKFEFEKIMDRQKEVIENLLCEKKKLAANYTEISEKYDQSEKMNQKKVSQMLENFELELKKNKDAWYQAEKMRRKKWEETKVKEIKDMTVKGLEPEYNRIFSRQKREMELLEDKNLEDQRRLKEKLGEEFERRLAEAKERFLKEKEEALDHERTLAGQRMRNQNERLDEEQAEERRRWSMSIQAEVQRVEKLRENDKKIYEDQILNIEERNIKLLEEKENYYKLKINETEKRYDDKIQVAQNDLIIRLNKEKERFVEEKQKELENKFKEMKHDLIKDRDKQLQMVIDKLSEETMNEKKKLLVECEAKADIINKELKQEREILHRKIQDLSDKLTAESKLRFDLEENLEKFSDKLKEKEILLTKKEKLNLENEKNYNEISDKYTNIAKEFKREKNEIEFEFNSKLQKFENEMRLIIEKNESQKSYYENMIVDIQKTHKEELVEVEEKIKKALSRKDDVIKKLQEDIHVKDLSINKLEDMLAKQRKELLMMHHN
jgi:5-azacytidine-induced protein 1